MAHINLLSLCACRLLMEIRIVSAKIVLGRAILCLAQSDAAQMS